MENAPFHPKLGNQQISLEVGTMAHYLFSYYRVEVHQ